MTVSPSDVALYRAALADVSALAIRDLLGRLRGFDVRDARRAQSDLLDVLPDLIEAYHVSAGAVAADWYDLMRLEEEVPGRFAAVVADPPSVGRAEALAGWAVGPAFGADDPTVARSLVLSKVSGGLTRAVLDGARGTIVGSTVADPARVGWRRATSGGCGFCEMLAGRGTVYSESSADFASHDHCRCSAVPDFGAARAVRAFTPSARRRR